MSGNDIPFQEAQLVIHQPSLKEIGYLGQDTFYTGCQFLNFSIQKIKEEQDKNRLKHLKDFEILMTILRDKDVAVKKGKVCIELVLLLLFPEYRIDFLPNSIMLSKQNEDQIERHLIDVNNFDSFKAILNEVFCLQQSSSADSKYNPGGPQAKALVQKFKKRQQKLAEMKSRGRKGNESVSLLSKMISVLAVGQRKSINSLLQYTVYQLFDEFQRFKLKQNFDIYVKAQLAGAQDLEEVKNWMSDLHSNDY